MAIEQIVDKNRDMNHVYTQLIKEVKESPTGEVISGAIDLLTEPICYYADAVHAFLPIGQELHESLERVRRSVNSGTVSSFTSRVYQWIHPLIRFNSELNYSVTLYWDTYHKKFVEDRQPNMTFPVMEWSFKLIYTNLKTNLGKAIIQHILDNTDESLQTMKEEFVKKLSREIKTSYKDYARSTYGLVDVVNGKVLWESANRYNVNEKISIRYIISMMEVYHETIGVEPFKSTVRALESINQDSFLTKEQMVRELRLPRKEHAEALKAFYSQEELDHLFVYQLTDQNISSKSSLLSYYENVGDLVSQEAYEFMLKDLIHCLTYRTTIIPYKNSDRKKAEGALEEWLKSKHAPVAVEKLGGIYTSKSFKNVYHIETDFNDRIYYKAYDYVDSDTIYIDGKYHAALQETLNYLKDFKDIRVKQKNILENLKSYEELRKKNPKLPKNIEDLKQYNYSDGYNTTHFLVCGNQL